jgi:hypothetical protein
MDILVINFETHSMDLMQPLDAPTGKATVLRDLVITNLT